MNFSDYFPQSDGLIKYQSNGNLVAVAKNFELSILETSTLRGITMY